MGDVVMSFFLPGQEVHNAAQKVRSSMASVAKRCRRE